MVEDDPGLPGPILTAAPTKIGWNVAPGSGPVTAELELTNVGGGAFAWVAVSDVPWLTLDAAAGLAVPAALRLTGDPSRVPDGTALRATVTLQALGLDGKPFQTVQVPVRLVVGTIWTREGPAPPTTTTTTLPAACDPPDCDDGDACTTDTCVDGTRCEHVPIAGYPGARYLCAGVPKACLNEKPPRAVLRRFEKGCDLFERAEAKSKPKRQRALLTQAAKEFGGTGKLAARAAAKRKPKLTAGCNAAFQALFADLRARADGVKPGR